MKLDDLDISMTPDFTDCMKLLNRAEKKVNFDLGKPDTRESNDSLLSDLRSADDFLSEYKPSDRYSSKSDPLTKDYRSSSKEDQFASEGKYSSKYYTGEDYKPTGSTTKSESVTGKFSVSAHTNLDSNVPTSRYQSSVIPSMSDYKQNANDDFHIPSSKSADRNTLSSETYAEKYRLASDKYMLPDAASGRFRSASEEHNSIPFSKDSDQYSVGTSSIPKFRPSLESGGGSTAGSLYSSVPVSTPSKYSTSGIPRPIGQSVFSRSPSLDNLFMQSKSTQNIGSKFATAEDIPTDYRSRLSLPSYEKFSSSSVGQGRLQSAALLSSTGSGKDFTTSALPPKPVRARSQSDLGTSVASLPSSSAYVGKGNIYPPAVSAGGGLTSDPTSYQPASQYLPPPVTSQSRSNTPQPTINISTSIPSASHNLPNNMSASHNLPSNMVSALQPAAPLIDSAKYANTLPPKLEVMGSLTSNQATNGISSASGPMKARTGYSYTDFDLGVNPKHKSKMSDLPLSTRVRSNSLDIPVDRLANFEGSNNKVYTEDVPYIPNSNYASSSSSYASYSSNSQPIIPHVTSSLTNPDNAYTVSLTGDSTRTSYHGDQYWGRVRPIRFVARFHHFIPSLLINISHHQ